MKKNKIVLFALMALSLGDGVLFAEDSGNFQSSE